MSRLLPPFAVCCFVASVQSFAACSSPPKDTASALRSDEWQSAFAIDEHDFATVGKNRYFVLEPGYQCTFKDADGNETLTITVLNETRAVDGVETRVVEERETKNDKIVEVSRNFFAISKRTQDVYYFGEEVDIYKDGRVVKHDGAWLSGQNGAKFGLFLPGEALVGKKFYQEVAPGVALDRCEIKSTEATFATPAGRFEHCLAVEETTPLEPKERARKHYAPGIGLIQDGDLVLVAHGTQDR